MVLNIEHSLPPAAYVVKMRRPSHGTDGSVVSPERALEYMSVEKAWTLLDDLSSQVIAKETELQVGPKETPEIYSCSGTSVHRTR